MKSKKSKKLLIGLPVSFIILIGLIIIGCETAAPPVETDTTAPTIESVTPLDKTTEVEPDTAVTVTASEAIDPTTITPDTVLVELNGISISEYFEVDTASYQLDEAGTKVTFSPPGGLALYSVFTITITTGVKDLAGNALEANYTWSFTTRDGSWGTAVELHTVNTGEPDYQSVKDPQVAFHDFGKANAVWSYCVSSVSPDYAYYTAYSLFDASQKQVTSWTEADNIQSEYMNVGYLSSLYPDIASNMAGTSVAVWRGYSSNGNIYGSVFSSDTWGADGKITPSPQSQLNYAYPQASVDPDGNALAVWGAYDPDAYYPFASFYDSETGTWENPVVIDNGDYVEWAAQFPHVAFDGTKKANVVWSNEYTDDNAHTLSSRYASWSVAEQRSSVNNTESDYRRPRIASNMNGVSFAVWRGGNLGYSYVYADRFTSDSWADSDKMISDDTVDSDAYYPQVAVDMAGNAIAVWEQGADIWANLFKADSVWPSWEGPIQLTDRLTDTYNNYAPRVVLDSSGNAIVVWIKDFGRNYKVYSRRYQTGSDWSASEFSPEELLSGDNVRLTHISPYDQYGVQIGIGPGGRAIAVWSYSTETIFANVFE